MFHTSYSNHSDQELLQVLIHKREQSPVIEELCQRLESYMPVSQKETNIAVDCPVCEAKLKIDIDVNQLNNYQLDINPA